MNTLAVLLITDKLANGGTPNVKADRQLYKIGSSLESQHKIQKLRKLRVASLSVEVAATGDNYGLHA